MLRDGKAVPDDFLFWYLFTSFPHRKNLEQGYTNFIYKTFAFRVPWKKPQLFTGRIYAPTTEILFPTTNIKFLRLVVLAVGNKSSLFTERSKYINRLEELVFYSCVRNLIIQEYLSTTIEWLNYYILEIHITNRMTINITRFKTAEYMLGYCDRLHTQPRVEKFLNWMLRKWI